MGGGSGGGQSGKVEFPAYMQNVHSEWLNAAAGHFLSTSITQLMNTAFGNSPFIGHTAFDPTNEVTAISDAIDDMQDMVDLLSNGTGLDDLIENILDPTRLDDVVTEYSNDLNAIYTSDTIPRYESGMRDINAVNSSAFVIGKGIIEDGITRQVAKFSSGLHYTAASDLAIKVITLKLQFQQLASNIKIEGSRIRIVALKEENEHNIAIDDSDARWDFEVMAYGGNLLGQIGGGTFVPSGGGGSGGARVGSTLGGALSGAVAGTQVGGLGWGTAIGAVVGGVSGYLSS